MSCDGQNYGRYKQCEGRWEVRSRNKNITIIIFIDKVQSDPFAPPSRMRVRLKSDDANYPRY